MISLSQKEQEQKSPQLLSAEPKLRENSTSAPRMVIKSTETCSPASNNNSWQSDAQAGLAPIDLTRRSMQFELSDFYVSRRFKSFVSSIVIPDGLIFSRLERMAECILRDFAAENQEISIVVTQDNSLKFYRDLQKKLTQRCLSP